jgi:hypothetical protein
MMGLKLTWDQWKAAGRHVGTYAGGIITGAVALGLITSADGASLATGLKDIVDGTGKLAAGIVTILGIIGPMYTAWRAQKSAAPENQAKATVKNLEKGVPLNGEKAKLIAAVADQPEIKKVEVLDPNLALAIPSNKVVS